MRSTSKSSVCLAVCFCQEKPVAYLGDHVSYEPMSSARKKFPVVCRQEEEKEEEDEEEGQELSPCSWCRKVKPRSPRFNCKVCGQPMHRVCAAVFHPDNHFADTCLDHAAPIVTGRKPPNPRLGKTKDSKPSSSKKPTRRKVKDLQPPPETEEDEPDDQSEPRRDDDQVEGTEPSTTYSAEARLRAELRVKCAEANEYQREIFKGQKQMAELGARNEELEERVEELQKKVKDTDSLRSMVLSMQKELEALKGKDKDKGEVVAQQQTQESSSGTADKLEEVCSDKPQVDKTQSHASEQLSRLTRNGDLHLKVKDLQKPPTTTFRDFQEWFDIYKGATEGYAEQERIFQLQRLLEQNPELKKAVAAVQGMKLLPSASPLTLETYLQQVRTLLERGGKQTFLQLLNVFNTLSQREGEGHDKYFQRALAAIQDFAPSGPSQIPEDVNKQLLEGFVGGFREGVVKSALHKGKPESMPEAVRIAEETLPSDRFVIPPQRSVESSSGDRAGRVEESAQGSTDRRLPLPSNRRQCSLCKNHRNLPDDKNRHSEDECYWFCFVCKDQGKPFAHGRVYCRVGATNRYAPREGNQQNRGGNRSGIKQVGEASPLIYARFGRVNTFVVIDTGAGCSCISRYFLKQLREKRVKYKYSRHYNGRKIHHSNGQAEVLKESIQIAFVLGGNKFEESFNILNIQEPIILGSPFFSKNKGVIDYGGKRLSVTVGMGSKQHRVSIPFCEQRPEEEMVLRLTAAAELAPLSIKRTYVPAPQL